MEEIHMKIPKHIEELIYNRAKTAAEFKTADRELSTWLKQHNITVNPFDLYSTGEIEAIISPWESANRVMKAIKNA